MPFVPRGKRRIAELLEKSLRHLGEEKDIPGTRKPDER
jgi:hypothetical protein